MLAADRVRPLASAGAAMLDPGQKEKPRRVPQRIRPP